MSHFRKAALSYRPGDEIAKRYRVTGVLGNGAFGAVYACEHVGTHQRVAVKMLSVDPDQTDDDVVARFLREARITARLRSYHTVQVFDVGQDDDGPFFMAMELLHGPDLHKLLRGLSKASRTMNERQVVAIGRQMLKSLGEAHRAGLVHRDLKPANIVLADMGDVEPVIKVLDFGIARTEDSSLTAEGKTLGTPAYMSPEQCRGLELDGRSDLYAVGCILFECLTGRRPYLARESWAVIQMHLAEPVPDPRELRSATSDALAACVMRAMRKDKNTRFADADEMLLALEDALAERPGAAPPQPAASEAAADQIADTLATGDRPPPLPTAFVAVPGNHDAAQTPELTSGRSESDRGPGLSALVNEGSADAAQGQTVALVPPTSPADDVTSEFHAGVRTRGLNDVRVRPRAGVFAGALLAACAVVATVWYLASEPRQTTSDHVRHATSSQPEATAAPTAALPAGGTKANLHGAAHSVRLQTTTQPPVKHGAPAMDAKVVQAEAKAELARIQTSVALKIRYMEQAVALAPDNQRYRILLQTYREPLARQLPATPTPVSAVPASHPSKAPHRLTATSHRKRAASGKPTRRRTAQPKKKDIDNMKFEAVD